MLHNATYIYLKAAHWCCPAAQKHIFKKKKLILPRKEYLHLFCVDSVLHIDIKLVRKIVDRNILIPSCSGNSLLCPSLALEKLGSWENRGSENGSRHRDDHVKHHYLEEKNNRGLFSGNPRNDKRRKCWWIICIKI